jgi:ankyrin repeat protein
MLRDGTETPHCIWATRKGRLDLVEPLRAAGASVAAEPDHEQTSLHAAAEEGFLEVLKRLLEADGINALNRFDYISRTPLMCAVEADQLLAAQILISAGADVNAFDEENIGNTALHCAVFSGTCKAVELLLNAGANPNISGWMGITAMDKAAQREDVEGRRILSLLKESVRILRRLFVPGTAVR